MKVLASISALFLASFVPHAAVSAYEIFWQSDFERHWGAHGTFHFSLMLAASMSIIIVVSYLATSHVSRRSSGLVGCAFIGLVTWATAVAFISGIGSGESYRHYWWVAWLLLAALPSVLLLVFGAKRGLRGEA
jgi:hypothetical protein